MIEIRQITIPICVQCLKLEGQMCHNPDCSFCRCTMVDVRERLAWLEPWLVTAELGQEELNYTTPGIDKMRSALAEAMEENTALRKKLSEMQAMLHDTEDCCRKQMRGLEAWRERVEKFQGELARKADQGD